MNITCPCCNGERKVNNFGGLREKCTACNGNGFVLEIYENNNQNQDVKIDRRSKAYRDSLREGV